MAILVLQSDALTPAVSPNDPANRAGASVRCTRWRLPATLVDADAESTIEIARLPQRARYMSQLSKLGWKGFGVGRTLDLGWRAYTLPDGTVVPEDATGLGTGLDVAADGRSFHDAFPLSSTDEVEFPVAAVLFLTVRGAAMPAGTTMGGIVCWLAGH